MRVKILIAALAMGAVTMSTAAQAQMGDMKMQEKMPAGASQTPAKAMDDLIGLLEGEMMGVVKAMPADKFGFAPSAAAFAPAQGAKFEGVRTFAEQCTHVAQANFYFYSAVSGLKPDVDMKAITTIKSKDEVVAVLAKSFAFAHQAAATITPQNAFLTIKAVDGMQTRASLAAFGVAHGYDHYGQMVEYLRMNGTLPPGSK